MLQAVSRIARRSSLGRWWIEHLWFGMWLLGSVKV